MNVEMNQKDMMDYDITIKMKKGQKIRLNLNLFFDGMNQSEQKREIQKLMTDLMQNGDQNGNAVFMPFATLHFNFNYYNKQ